MIAIRSKKTFWDTGNLKLIQKNSTHYTAHGLPVYWNAIDVTIHQMDTPIYSGLQDLSQKSIRQLGATSWNLHQKSMSDYSRRATATSFHR